MDVSEAGRIISDKFDQDEARILSEYETNMTKLDDARYRIEKQYDSLEDMIALYNINPSDSLLILRRNPIYTRSLTEINNILSVDPLMMDISTELYAEFRHLSGGLIHLVFGDTLSFVENYDISPSIPDFEGRFEGDTKIYSDKYSPLRLDSKKDVTLLPFLDEVFSYINGVTNEGDGVIESLRNISLNKTNGDNKKSEAFMSIDEIAGNCDFIDSVDFVYEYNGEFHIELSGNFSDTKKFLEKYMPESKDAFNPVFFTETENDNQLLVVKSPEFIPVGVPDSNLVLVPA